MEFLVTLVVTVAAVLVLREPVKRWPVAFYVAAIVVVVSFFAGLNGLLPGSWWKPLVLLVQRCMVALALFAIVMFIGVLPKGSKLDMRLCPIRAEISIIACILCMGHMCVYLAPYASRALSGSLANSMLASFVVAIVLFVLLIVLGITSFNFVKQRMGGATWKKVQLLAYPFFGLAWVHLMFMLAPAAMRGGEQAVLSVAIYSILFAAYAVLRLHRRRKDGGAEPQAGAAEAQAS